MFGIGPTELIIIFLILLLLFGASRLGNIGSELGKGIKGFKRAMREPDEIDVTPSEEEKSKSIGGSSLEKAGEPAKEKEEAKKES